MNDKLMPFVFALYVTKITKLICSKYGYDENEALHIFLFSETYRMLVNPELQMSDFSINGIFDMWEVEQITGEPRNSLYIRKD